MPIEKKIKYRTLGVLIFIIFGFGIFILYQVNSYIDTNFKHTLKDHQAKEKKLFDKILKQHSKMYANRIDYLLSDNSLVDAFASKDRDLLFTKTISTFKQFQKENKYIKILTFRLQDGSTFLRVHKPKMFGDSLNKKRKIIIDTNNDKQRKLGFEIGKLKMTYRIVTPIFKDGNYLGLVEFGIEPEAFMKVLSNVVDLRYALVVRKDNMKVVFEDFEEISKDTYTLMSNDKLFIDIFNKIKIKDHTFITLGDKELAIDANLVLKDHKDKVQAYFITIDDITYKINKASDLKQSLTISILISMILLILLLNYSINFYIKSIKSMFYKDELTGLLNRNALIDKLTTTTDTSTLFLIDISDFKTINELYGVSSGNYILKQMGDIITKMASIKQMTAFRISSDEFVLFSYNTTKALDLDMVQEIFIAIKEQRFIIDDLDVLVDVDINIGAAYGKKVSLEKVDMALKNARTKHLDYVIYSEEIDTKKDTTKIVQVKRDTIYALENNNIVPYFQPIVDKDENIIKYEALMRMIKLDSGKQELILPFYFLELSFKFNLYSKLSKTIIKQSFEVLKTTDKLISINLAPSDILDTTMNNYVINTLTTCVNPQQIVVEITENEDITDFELIKKFILDVKATGAKIAIDDFGSGYANYTHIFELKPDYIKIDGTLIKDIVTNKDNQIFVKTIISMSKELGIKTIAEYVHSKEVFELVKSYGVDEFQGYYFGQAQEKIN